MDQATPKTTRSAPPPRDSPAMLALLGMLAYAASTMTHEALGHAAFCRAIGGHTILLTAWREDCRLPGELSSAIQAAGPGAQFGAGLLAWLVQPRLAGTTAGLRYFLWLYMAFNLLIASSYAAFSGLTNFGDAAAVLKGYRPPMLWRTGLVLFGCAAYFLSVGAALPLFKRFAGEDAGSRRLFRLLWVPYVSAGCYACCLAALDRSDRSGLSMMLAALSSFGSGAGLFLLPPLLRLSTRKSFERPVFVQWSFAWSTAAALLLLLLLVLAGPVRP